MSLSAPVMASCAIVFNAFIWGISWWPLQHMRSHGLHPLWASSFMYVVPLLGLLLWRSRQARVDFMHQPQLWLLVLSAGLTNACFNWAVTIGDVVRVVLLFYLMPLWAVLLARWLLDEAIRPSAIGRMVLALVGVMLVMQPETMHWQDWRTWQLPIPRTLPDVLALLGGFFFACTNIFLRKTAADVATTSRILAMFMGSVCISGLTGAILALVLGTHTVSWPAMTQWTQWLPWVGLSSLMFVVANAALSYGSRHLSAQGMSVLMLTEVLFASVSSIATGTAHPTPHTLPGALLIMGAALLAALAGASRSRNINPVSHQETGGIHPIINTTKPINTYTHCMIGFW